MRRLAAGLLALVVTVGLATPAGADQPFTSAVFVATHNSFSGGARGSITFQLEHGVRFLELDVREDGFTSTGDFSIGHGSVGDQVDHGPGNPASNLLWDWLSVISAWSSGHPTHAPLV